MLSSLASKVAVVTGGAAGIGAACCRLFAQHGAKVVVADINKQLGESLAQELGSSATFVPCDVTQEADLAGAVQAAINTFGSLDVMCNNAGISGKQGRQGLLENLDIHDFETVMNVNLRGAMLGTKHAARAMKTAGTKGCIINTASVAGLRVNLSTAGPPVYIPAAYTASKHAMIGVTRLGACELAPWGIRVNAVAPGVTATHVVGQFLTGKADPSPQEVERALMENSVLHGVALLPDDVANAMLFLASDMARCINGHTLVVDLGVTVGVSGEITLVPGTLT